MGVETRQSLIIWARGDADSEYLAAALVKLDGATDVDPVHPQGGPDGKKDILCTYKGVPCIVAVNFPNDSTTIKFSVIKKKFASDLKGVKKNGRKGFLFVTNAPLTNAERETLEASATAAGVVPCIIYHLERIHLLLDDPSGYGIREKYLGIALSEAERISFEQEKRLQDHEVMRQAVRQEVEAAVKAALAQILGPGGAVK